MFYIIKLFDNQALPNAMFGVKTNPTHVKFFPSELIAKKTMQLICNSSGGMFEMNQFEIVEAKVE